METITTRELIFRHNAVYKALQAPDAFGKAGINFALVDNHKTLASKLESFNDAEEKLIRKHAVKDENGEPRLVERKNGQRLPQGYLAFQYEDLAAMEEERNELLEQKVSVSLLSAPKAMVLSDEGSASSEMIFELDWMFE